MNFKFTKWKTIVASVVAIILSFWNSYSMIWFGGKPDNWIWIQIGTGIITFVIFFVIIYIIWCLIEKKA